MIYHVTKRSDWEKAKTEGYYEAASLHTEGFIHNSTKSQVAGVLDRYYRNEKDLVLLHIDEATLTSPLKYELAASVNEMFPHIYGTINLDAVIEIEIL
jgi:uncharacterized protein (DUF952 family)